MSSLVWESVNLAWPIPATGHHSGAARLHQKQSRGGEVAVKSSRGLHHTQEPVRCRHLPQKRIQQKEEKKERVPIVTIRDRDFSFEECRVQTIQKDGNGNLELE
ncbi:hypothetical protein NC653_020621 [Populus alba x Populus x berolinensis]|uniref:Uncharacterized protein n=1 Tax=Populus alba x Populus x berolinensis TaxID=444605 RepID=A0AAD6ML76_9ROSI|nr:hypothetical protein NC653_020621 [Populus alba x Populus x berolinensis]